MVELNVLWFVLVGVLFTGFIFLEGFDFGVGALVPIVAKTDEERRIAINTIGPVWDGNEVWLLTAGGAMFAAFPYWYATMFSGFYMALFLVLVSLIVRGVTFEFRNKVATKKWRNNWDWALSISSTLCALLFPVAFANLIGGVPLEKVNGHLDFTGNFFSLLTPYTLVAGLAGLSFMLYHGSVYLSLKTSGPVLERSQKLSKTLGLSTLALGILFAIVSLLLKGTGNMLSVGFFTLTLLIAIGSYFMSVKKSYGTALLLNGFAVVTVMISLFSGLFPNVMISSIDPALSLSIANASSSPYTLKVMTIVAFTLLPIVLGCQIWSFKVFKGRVTPKDLKY